MRQAKKLSNEEIASFCNQTALLFQSGISPLNGIAIMLKDNTSTDGKVLLEQISKVCDQGEPFHKALECTGVFPDYVIRTVAMGEESGNLDICMLSLADYYEKEVELSEAIRSAVSYPLIMIAMMFVVIFILISRVLPVFQQVFAELGSEMNGFAAALLRLGYRLNRYSFVLLIFVILFVVLYLFLTRTSTGRLFFTGIWKAFPLTKSYYDDVARQRFASGLALCLKSGMDTYVSLDVVKQLVSHEQMQKKIDSCIDYLKSGMNLAEALTQAKLFNNLYSQMILVGFTSGNADRVLSKIAVQYEHSGDRKIQTLISLLEPTLVIILSGIVGLILLSVILPLMGIMTSIG
ncbi:MAG: type II secretion system F family protein [Acetatifactor sp.]|nr:type II secretion system F family protein [Acetatifactor sp.]